MSSRSQTPRLVATVLMTGLGVAACGTGGASEEVEGARHVLLITLDTTRADHLGCYGNPEVRTPALDSLAAEGTRFDDCTSAAATTLASHTSIVTGTYPHRHGSTRNGFPVNRDNVTLAERLRDAGFWSAAVLGSSALLAETGFDQGFHHYDDDFDIGIAAGGADQDQRSAASVTKALLAHVDEVRGRDGGDDARLFLFAQYFDPHAPYAPPASEVERYGAAMSVGDFDDIESAVRQQQKRAIGSELGQNAVIQRGMTEPLVRRASGVPTATGRALAKLYAGEVTAMDAAIGELLLGLASRGILDDTLVVVTADHGETFWEHGNAWNHGLWVSQTDVHVPLIVRMPNGRGGGRVVRTPVSGVDIAPTILEALGLDGAPSGPSAGRSLLGAIDGAALDELAVFAEATQPGSSREDGGLPWRNAAKPQAARLGQWKLVRAPYLGMEQLFDLKSDPQERLDLLANDPNARALAKRDELRIAFERWTDAADPLDSSFDPTQALRLQGLGYAEATTEDD